MSLSPGSRLGPYEILAPLGAGGMGEVYRARDAKLGRDIAVKVLPAALASDPDRRQRFEQEARSASALNHPNILTIYDIGETNGTTYIAMELIEGKTLRELVASGEPLPTRRLLDLAVQIADGLAKAHSAGIVHRDLKPENVMISKDGFAKILDFGLAKLAEPATHDGSALPTAVAPGTAPGTVMGTVGYMSPEQASGHSVDFRSDQFTLGSILYEMATGKRAFSRRTGAETLAAIIREEPEPMAQAAPKAPAPVRWIVERCLAKDPEERYASSKDLARDLKSVRDHLSETSASGGIEAAHPARARRRGWLAPAILTLLLGSGLGYLAREVFRGRPDSAVRYQPLTFRRGSILSSRFAPDGQTIVYSAAWDGRPLELFSTRADSTESRSLGLPPADILSISSTGEMAISLDRHYTLGFETTGTLARVPLGGGAPRPILEDVETADWSPDGQSLAVSRRIGNRYRLEYPIGKTIYESASWISSVRVSPDGRLVAILDNPRRGNNEGVVKVLDTEGKVRLEGPRARGAIVWSPRGDEVWSLERGVQATMLSGKTRMILSVAGTPALHDAASDGRMLLGLGSFRREMVGVEAGGNVERNLTWLNWSFPVDIAQDGKSVLFDEQNIKPEAVYLRALNGAPAIRLGEGNATGLSADGRWALTLREDGGDHFVLLPTGPGEPRPIARSNLALQWAEWFPDGRRVLIAGSEPGRGVRLYVQEVPDGQPRAITPEGAGGISGGVSPDGSRFAAVGPDGRLMIYPVGPGEPHAVPGLAPTDRVSGWTADGRSLYVLRASAPPARIHTVDVATGTSTPFRDLQPPDPAGVLFVFPAHVTPDGSAYVYSYRRILDELFLVTGTE